MWHSSLFFSVALTALTGPTTAAQPNMTAQPGITAPPLMVREVSGGAEQQLGTWQAVGAGQRLQTALRVGSGRARLQSGQGQVLVASASALRVYRNEPDLQSGHFYLSGDLRFFARQAHLAGSGQVRLDLNAPTLRVAVISGSLRISLGSSLIKLSGGEQYDFTARRVTAFVERDPWYRSRFVGEGQAQIEATNGQVQLQSGAASVQIASPGDVLSLGQALLTGAQAWAEVGFSGGGYLRLQPDSALSVISVDKLVGPSGTAQRQITLQLTRGSAWNVVAEHQGGYEISTPTITTAVRGTLFRVDASGLIKVLDGQVAVPSQQDLTFKAGAQRASSGKI